MAKRCPPGVICIENITITLVLIIVGCVVLFLNMYSRSATTQQPIVREKVIVKENGNEIFQGEPRKMSLNLLQKLSPYKLDFSLPRNIGYLDFYIK